MPYIRRVIRCGYLSGCHTGGHYHCKQQSAEPDCCAYGVNFLRLFFAKVRGVQGAVYVLREASACNPVRTSAWVLARMFFKSRLLRGTYRVSAAAALCSSMYSVLR